MGKSDRIMPPRPNPREDMMKEKDQEQLRRMHRERGHQEYGQESSRADQTEGERSGEPARKMRSTPDQAEGDRKTIESELEMEEKKRH